MEFKDIIEGRNPVIEALKSDREINKILIAKGNLEGSIKKIVSMAKDKKIIIQYVDKNKIKSLSESDNHQGVIAYVSPYKYYDLEEILYEIKEKQNSMLVICDEINDPHNLGSIIRTANASGCDGVIIPKRRSASVNSVVAKTSAGAIEYVKVAKVTNLSQTIDILKENGFWIVGLDMKGESTMYNSTLKGKIVIIVGNEGKGMSRIVREKCDFLVRIPMLGKVSSLNASVAASLLMYEVVRQCNESE